MLEASALRLGDGGCDDGERGELSGEVVGGVIFYCCGDIDRWRVIMSCELIYSLYIASVASWRAYIQLSL